jgi:nitrite reductase/ring-hydroxylating ferredoxin subunit
VLPFAELVEGELHRVTVGDTAILLNRDADDVRAVSSTCTHMGGPLQEGRLKDGCVVCPWHGSAFRFTDGHVVRGPATSPLPAYETRVLDGRIEVRAADSGKGPIVG